MKKRNKIVFGVDEAGRGCLAAPVIAAAVAMINWRKFVFKFGKIREIKDSKKLSAKKREEIFKILKNCSFIEWGLGRVSEKKIDKINILEATKLAMVKAVRNLAKKIKKKPNLLLIDGNFKIPIKIKQKTIIKGDEKIPIIKLASIIAKVKRDKIMEKYHLKYPQYGFSKHKGYPTKHHFKMLKRYGPCKIHRKTFKPVKNLKLLK